MSINLLNEREKEISRLQSQLKIATDALEKIASRSHVFETFSEERTRVKGGADVALAEIKKLEEK